MFLFENHFHARQNILLVIFSHKTWKEYILLTMAIVLIVFTNLFEYNQFYYFADQKLRHFKGEAAESSFALDRARQ